MKGSLKRLTASQEGMGPTQTPRPTPCVPSMFWAPGGEAWCGQSPGLGVRRPRLQFRACPSLDLIVSIYRMGVWTR